MGNPQDYEEVQPKWPHLENHYKVDDFFTRAEWLTVTEKIHGFNARFGRTESGIFWVGSRKNIVWEGVDESAFPQEETLHSEAALQGFTVFAGLHASDVAPGYTYFGEWAGPGIQKGVDYGENKRFFLFAVSRMGDRHEPIRLLDWEQTTRHAENMNLAMVPTLYDGPATDFDTDWLTRWAAEQSSVSEDEREGVCVTAWPPLHDQYGHMLILKYKNPKFAERAHARKPKAPPPDITHVQAFVDDYATTERLNHVLQQVEEQVGDTPYFPEYTGHVLRTYYNDVVREGEDDFNDLSETDQKMVGRILNQTVKPMLEEYRATV